MPRLDLSTRRRVIALTMQGYSMMDIKKRLEEESVLVTRQSLYKLVNKYRRHHTYVDLPRKATPKKLTPEMYMTIESELTKNDELTAAQLRGILRAKYPLLEVSLTTIKRARRDLDWVCTRPHYCQLIRELNKRKRLFWCKEQLRLHETFDDVIFTDESSIQLDHHSRVCFRKKLQPRALKQRAKHPVKIHVWGNL